MARVLGESGYEDMWRADKTPEAPGRLENLKELQTALEEFDDLAGFLEHISLVMENESSSSDDKVTLMTLHGAKGLEFDTVFLPGWEEGLFPHQRALDEGHGKALEEERRLAYVGLTRARKAAHVSFAANRRIYGNWQSAIPSRFVEELPADHVDVSAERGVYGGGFDNEKPRFRSSGRSHRTEPTWATTTSSGSGDFEIGQRIFHQKFGYGAIREIDGDKLEIAFEKAGTKKVMAGFVEET